jgi:hypothetical protein
MPSPNRFLLYFSAILVIFCMEKISFANWDSFDSPDFLTHQSAQAIHIQRQMGDILQFAPLIMAVGMIAYYGIQTFIK